MLKGRRPQKDDGLKSEDNLENLNTLKNEALAISLCGFGWLGVGGWVAASQQSWMFGRAGNSGGTREPSSQK